MIRKVRQEEVHHLYPFVYRILSDMDLPLLDTLEDEKLAEIVIEAMESPQYRYGYEHAWVCLQESRIAGVLFGYPGEHISLVDGPLHVALAECGFSTDKIITPKPETHAGEWYLDAVSVAPLYEDRGIAQRLLQIAGNLAKDAGYATVALNCPVDDERAYSLYKEAGFEGRTKILLGDKAFYHMTKKA